MLIPSLVQTKPAVVLLVDPDEERQRETRDRLIALGYTVRSVDDYEAALVIIESTPPDVVLITGQPAQGEGWNALRSMLTRWGVPALHLEQEAGATTEDASKTLK